MTLKGEGSNHRGAEIFLQDIETYFPRPRIQGRVLCPISLRLEPTPPRLPEGMGFGFYAAARIPAGMPSRGSSLSTRTGLFRFIDVSSSRHPADPNYHQPKTQLKLKFSTINQKNNNSI